MSRQALFTHLYHGNLKTFPAALELYLKDPRHSVDDQDAKGFTLLMRAVVKGNLPIVKFLLEKGAKIDSTDCDGNTVLMCTLYDTHLPIIEWLIKNGALLDTKNTKKKTPLMLAARQGQVGVVRFLLSKQVNVHEKDKDGNTALMHAVSSEKSKKPIRQEIIRLLVESGELALIDAQNVLRKTVLMSAAELGYIEAVRFLLSKNANPNLEDYLKFNALGHALKNGHIEVADVLVHYGAKAETALSSPLCIQKTIYELFWDALRIITVPPKQELKRDPELEYSEDENEEDKLPLKPPILAEMLTEHNNKLSKHPTQTAEAIGENTTLYKSMAQLIGDYLYGEKALWDTFQLELPKAIIFSGPLVPDKNANSTTSLAEAASPKLAKKA